MTSSRNPSSVSPASPDAGRSSIARKELTNQARLKLLQWMLNGRLNDDAEQALKRRGQGHFQMSSQGHEGLVGMALAMRDEDWLHPHYRDRPLIMARGVSHEQMFLDYFAKRNSSTGGRQMPVHYNSRRHRIVTLSSPVATNILQGVGMAMSLKARNVPEVVVASIGDASTRSGEVYEAITQAVVDVLPVIFLIEDNGIGISTPTSGKTFWTIKNSVAKDEQGSEWFLGCRLVRVDGTDVEEVYHASCEALERARKGGGPTCLILSVVRMGSHSSSDDQRIYRAEAELVRCKQNDPLLKYERFCVDQGVATREQIEGLKSEIAGVIEEAISVAKAAPDPDPSTVRNSAFAPLPDDLPSADQGQPVLLPKRSGGLTMAQCLSLVLSQELRRNPRMWVFGEDIEDPKGDVFSTTKGLSTQFPERVQNSPLAEATIMGVAVGRALMGDFPVSCIQFVDFLGPALNQLLNEVVTMYWRSNGQWNCPMVVMAPYGGYLPGLGPWHSQTNEAIFAHVPGLHVVIPSRPGDAAGLLRYALRCGRPVLFLYPKALLHGAEETVAEPGLECMVPFGRARIDRPGKDVTIVTWGNCVAVSRAAAQRATREGIEVEILDLRTIVPWDARAVIESVKRTGRLLVVHEDAKTCGLGGDVIAEVIAAAQEHLVATPLRVTKTDDHNPYQFGLELSILPSVDDILSALKRLFFHQVTRSSQAPVQVSDGALVAPVAGFAPVPPLRASADSAKAFATAVRRDDESDPAGPVRLPVIVPKQSPTDEDATLVRYLVNVGDKVKAGDKLAELEANKGSFELESQNEGRVVELVAREGDRVRVGGRVMYLEADAGSRVEETGVAAEPAGEAALKQVRLTQAQLQVGALALKSQLEIPTVSVETEVDMTRVVSRRRTINEIAMRDHQIHVTYTHVILWAIVKAMMDDRHQGFRGVLDTQAECLWVAPHANVGFAAVGPSDDLFSPCIQEADRLDFVDLVRRTQELTESVRVGSINSHDLQGAQVTLTNIGSFGATGGTPFVIPGQLAMVCAGSLLERPRYIKGENRDQIELQQRSVLPLKLVFDHRPFNGSYAATFLRSIKTNLEELDLDALISHGRG